MASLLWQLKSISLTRAQKLISAQKSLGEVKQAGIYGILQGVY